jgi:hypothetical protein
MHMSEDRSRFSIKNGDIEITYEGTSKDVNARYAEAFQWIKDATLTEKKGSRKARSKKTKEQDEGTGSKKSEKHTEGVASGIDKLIMEGWFDTDRKNSDVLEELKRKGASGLYIEAIDTRLKRRLKTNLERHQDESGNWLYRKKKT